jgi:Flp pilus assembly protein TadG
VKSKRAQRGATIVEAAVTAVALFTLIIGAAEFGRAYSMFQTLTDAAREGARYAVAPDSATQTLPSSSAVTSYIKPLLDASNIGGSTVTVSATNHTVNGVTVTYSNVTVKAPYTFFFFPFGTINVSANAEMRNETN